MPRLTARAGVLAGLYAALGIANSASAAKRFRAGECATKPLLMPVLAALALVAAGDRKEEMRLPAAGMALSGLGDTALLGSENWFVPGMGAFAAAHACYIAALARDGATRGVRARVAAGYTVLWAVLIAVLWRGLGRLRVPVAAYSLLLVSMAVLASGRNREAWRPAFCARRRLEQDPARPDLGKQVLKRGETAEGGYEGLRVDTSAHPGGQRRHPDISRDLRRVRRRRRWLARAVFRRVRRARGRDAGHGCR